MTLLKQATNQTAFLKAGILGFAGSGKTYTATELAIGLCKTSKATKAAFYDTETGSDFMIPKFKSEGIELFVHKGRAFTDLLSIIKEAEQGQFGVLIIDSITHVWRELVSAYIAKFNRKGNLQFQDWAVVKAEWQRFSDAFVNSKVHIIICGRAGYEYDDVDAGNGSDKKIKVKTGTKMKVEGEFGFEPSLLLEMERINKVDGIGWINSCHVLKDRTDTINSKSFDYPKFKNFESVVKFLNIGGEHLGLDTQRTSEGELGKRAKPTTSADPFALEELKEKLSTIEKGEERLLKYLSTKFNGEIKALSELTTEEIAFSMKFLNSRPENKAA